MIYFAAMDGSEITLSEICAILAKEAGMPSCLITPTSDLERDLGITGDDFSDLMERFAKRFEVDMTEYKWYFHHKEEFSLNPGAFFFAQPYNRVAHIPVTPNVLLEAVARRKWPIKYPAHRLPTHRYDIAITWSIYLLFALWMLYLKYAPY